jgi:uncharacterized membrane protein HdeD (DUF308 family)
MDMSMFLAKLVGLYFLVIALDLLLRRHDLKEVSKDFATSKRVLMMSGSVSLVLGLVILINNPMLSMDCKGLLSLVGYLMVIKSISRVVFAEHFHKKMPHMIHKCHGCCFVVALVIGALLTYCGFSGTMC